MKKLYSYFLVTTLFSCFSCNNSTFENKKEIAIEKCIPYFTFDSIEHYYVEVDSKGVSSIEKKKELSEGEREQLNIMYKDTVQLLEDTIMYQNLERINFIKALIPSHKFDTINKIFCSRIFDECGYTNCIPTYRDILIFKNKNQTIGIAKICFHCKQSLIIGASDKTSSICFKDGDNYIDDYSRLKEILYSK